MFRINPGSGHAPAFPWVRSEVWVGAGLEVGVAVREGWVDTSLEPWIDPMFRRLFIILVP